MSGNLLVIATKLLLMAAVSYTVLLIAGIMTVIIIHVYTVGRVIGRLRSIRNGDHDNGLSSGDVEKLPSLYYKCGEKEASREECPICLESFNLGDICKVLPLCGHVYHARCVDFWLTRSAVCPLCRKNVDPMKQNGDQQRANVD
ncbi:hypothetical protein HPP92_018657 [Vanilla planifolia]|uniref:RING-type domain-containing protein n=1 Tax=Vanilla planifolia TaxID=51239 RepID=A0A835UN37_VANPL|nr:hypothetical protein HPP92_019249 [Vanilla planifolia]KAG0469329.1 hypothetical protein HPP92_018657 [Vanilla planifolia]